MRLPRKKANASAKSSPCLSRLAIRFRSSQKIFIQSNTRPNGKPSKLYIQLEHVPEKLTNFSDQNMLQEIDFERIPIG